MAIFRVPYGPLASWNGVDFTTSPTKLLPGWKRAATPARGFVLGQPTAFDRFGTARVPVEISLGWEVLLSCRGGQPPTHIQDVMDALTDAYESQQVATLVAFKYASTTTLSGLARLDELTEVEGQPTWKRVQMTFFFPNGLTEGATATITPVGP